MSDQEGQLDKLESRLAWRAGGSWERIECGDRTGLESIDDRGRRWRIFPHESGELACFGSVAALDCDVPCCRRMPIDTWGQTPQEAIERGRKRLDEHLAEIAAEHDEEPPELPERSTRRERSVAEDLEASALDRAMAAENVDVEADPEQEGLFDDR
ncbi:MAG: hypothetical protein ABEN55_00045 [Bradymonadaceae bacterium]